MNVISKWRSERGTLHFTLIDPDKQPAGKAAEMARQAESFGSDAIMIGGSTAGSKVTDDCTKAIKDASRLPTILFPSKAAGVSRHADYLFFMMMMNSKSRRFLVEEQMKAAPHLKKLGVKPIPMGYIVISTSENPTTVELVGEADRIGVSDMEKAVAYALTSQYYGMDCVYLEAGSGAEKPVPLEMVKAVKSEIGIPLIVGGGIRDPDTAKRIVSAGADVIVTGTIAERDPRKLEGIIRAVKQG